MATAERYLDSLNDAQRRAVEHDPRVPLQILAGPGSGKTKVLTSRIARLITHHSLPPRAICAVTYVNNRAYARYVNLSSFTKKAANEMRERLEKLIGKEKTTQVQMGTFHALCALYIRKYAVHVGIKSNFTVCDTDEGKKIITSLLKARKELLKEKEIELSAGNVQSKISHLKAKCISANDLLAMLPDKFHPLEIDKVKIMDQLIAEIYREYEDTLKVNNSLDFDDLLIVGLSLFKSYPPSVSWCKHVLVDEFQDTNHTQYGLMRALGVARCVTIVGDPDQSIYGWRAAEVANLSKMQDHFPGTEQILLEENYRSTASILKCSLAIVSQDEKRIPKALHTSHPNGVTPILRACESEINEATFIAMEIKRVIAHMGGCLNWGDFVILLRFNALSRSIESALQKEGIPSRILGGHKFFDRMEIKDILAYLQLADNPNFAPAFTRAANVPARGIGEKTLSEIFAKADGQGLSALELVEKIHDGRTADIKPAIKRKLSSFVTTIRKLRTLANGGAMPSDLIRTLLKSVAYEEHLKKTQPDWDVRWENVRELITFAGDVQGSMQDAASPEDADADDDTPLRMFLQASMLSSEGDSGSEEDNKDKVTISTCHAAKGLEWPVVIVPSVEEGTFPFYRAEDNDEERRLLYVACTRAKSLLYLTRCVKRTIAGQQMDRETSHFITKALENDQRTITQESLCMFTDAQRSAICTVLQRPAPLEMEVTAKVDAFYLNIRNRQSFRNLNTGLSDFMPAVGDQRAFQQIGAQNTRHPAFVPVRQLDIKPDVRRWEEPRAFNRKLKTEMFDKKPKREALDVKPTWLTRHALTSTATAPSIRKNSKRPSDAENLPDVKLQPVASSSKVKKEPSIMDLTMSPPEPEEIKPQTQKPKKEASIISIPSSPPSDTKSLPPKVLQPPTSNLKKEPSIVEIRSNIKPMIRVASAPPLDSSAPSHVPKKRHLGMGRGGTGYANKKFKTPTT